MTGKPEWFNDIEAASYIGMSVSFLRQGRLHGIVGNRTPPPAYHKLGESVRYERRDLDAWLAARRVDPLRRKQTRVIRDVATCDSALPDLPEIERR